MSPGLHASAPPRPSKGELSAHSAGPELETPRLRLRGFRADDLDAYARITDDLETMRYIGSGRALGRDEAWRSLGYLQAHWEIRGYGLWAAEERATGALVGRIGLHRPDGWPGLEVGWLVARERWGEGLATEGASAALAHAFTAVGVRRVVSVIQPGNAASVRVAEKLGEHLAEERWLRGHRVRVYAIGRAEWEARRGAAGPAS